MKKFISTFVLAALAATIPALAAHAALPKAKPTCAAVKTPFLGTLCTPGDGKRHPAMILLGGSEGGNSMSRTAMVFAKHGYVTASVAYFGMPGLPKYLVNVPVETVGHALAALQARRDVYGNEIGIMGGSKGCEFTLLAASTYPLLHAVVALVPSPVAFMGLGHDDMPTGCSWSQAGKPLPCVPASASANMAIGRQFAGGKPVSLRPFYDASLDADPAMAAKAFSPLQNIHAPVLCLAAADDAMWNLPRQCTMTMSYLKAHHHAYADREIIYPDAGHLFLFSPWIGAKELLLDPIPGTGGLAFGGTVTGDLAASKAARATIWRYLGRTLHATGKGKYVHRRRRRAGCTEAASNRNEYGTSRRT